MLKNLIEDKQNVFILEYMCVFSGSIHTYLTACAKDMYILEYKLHAHIYLSAYTNIYTYHNLFYIGYNE